MKRILALAMVAASFTACKSERTPADTEVLGATSAAELQEFRVWKAEQQLKKTQDSLAAAQAMYAAPVRNTNTVTEKVVYRDAPVATSTAPVAQKKRWSHATKGAVIGAGTGAVAGAVINKRNRAAGGVVGGIIGGGVGYVIGKSKDNKENRR